MISPNFFVAKLSSYRLYKNLTTHRSRVPSWRPHCNLVSLQTEWAHLGHIQAFLLDLSHRREKKNRYGLLSIDNVYRRGMSMIDLQTEL